MRIGNDDQLKIEKLKQALDEANYAYDYEVATNAKMRERVQAVLAWCDTYKRILPTKSGRSVIHCATTVEKLLKGE